MTEKAYKYEFDISVIVPVYNAEEYIDACVDSIIKQNNQKIKVEILLIDDGSLDRSGEICCKLENQYSCVRYIRKENTGVSDTRNTGIMMAKGKYILMLDSDDYISDNAVNDLFNFFENHYEEVDLVTYPIYWDRNGRISAHPRYSRKNYDKGTGLYDLDEYPGLNQSTVNIIFKNQFDNNILYNSNMRLSEDQYFNTCILMCKKRIGFVESAKYYYRRHGFGVSQTRNNPYYCFDEIMAYNERILEQFQENGKTAAYVQALTMNTFKWRVDTDELIPYHYSWENLEKAKGRIAAILKKIDNYIILNYSNLNDFTKIMFLRWKGEELLSNINENGFSIELKNGESICEKTEVICNIYRVEQRNDCIEMFAAFESPILELLPADKYVVEGTFIDGSEFRVLNEIHASKVPSRGSKMRASHIYAFTYKFQPEKIKNFNIKLIVNGNELNSSPKYFRFSGFIRKYHRESIVFGKWRLNYKKSKKIFTVSHNNVFKTLSDIIKTVLYYPKKHLLGILYYRMKANAKRNIWLYSDSPGVLDNGYYQFLHDMKKDDGVERYYIMSSKDSNLYENFSKEVKDRVVWHKSKKHKDLFLKCSKILMSYSSLSIYSPFQNITWYSDKLNYELIYLQHGILHASLPRLYGKEFTEIDKFIVSSEFERKNLKENYDYNEDDIIVCGMPRMSNINLNGSSKNKILFAPSWREYLIGPFVNNSRELRVNDFLKSEYFLKIKDFLKSQRLKELLKNSGLILEVKMHPIFKPYEKYFYLEDSDNIRLATEKIVLSDYNLLITDFSSYQFDFIELIRPVIYFLPDEREFMAGLHSYRSLDLKYDDAFGNLCKDSNGIVDEIKKIIDARYQPEEKFKERMENFFSVSGNPCEEIYNTFS